MSYVKITFEKHLTVKEALNLSKNCLQIINIHCYYIQNIDCNNLITTNLFVN
jgi:hypothetical protein